MGGTLLHPLLDLLLGVCCGTWGPRNVLKHVNVEASPAEPRCELQSDAVCY